MPSDDLSSRDPDGPAYGPETDELAEATERLESAGWDPFEETPTPRSRSRATGVEREAHTGPIRSFLERQLQERPLPTLVGAVAAGWLVGKLLR